MHSLQLACNTCNRAKWAQWRKLQIDNTKKKEKEEEKEKEKDKTKQNKQNANKMTNWPKKKKKAVTEATET